MRINLYSKNTYDTDTHQFTQSCRQTHSQPFILTLDGDFAHTPALDPNWQEAKVTFFRIRFAKERDTE